MNLESLDWEVLDRLRETFLSNARAEGPYWHTITDLECYDLTYGERIGWKWDSVLKELHLRGWLPPAECPIIFDWGCGSGIAGRRVVDFCRNLLGSRLVLHDHSALALDYAEHRARAVFPQLRVQRADYREVNGDSPIDILVVSHVLNELNERARLELAGLMARARCILWVEPGTHEVSRALVAWREQLRTSGARVIAPCTHDAGCGLLAPGNERHWCHFFATPPPEIFSDSNWVRFGQRAGIDLRSLPYSFLVLDRRAAPTQANGSRILGDPRIYKGYAKLFNCSVAGLEELTMQQRVDKALFKELKRARGPLLYRWTRDADRILAAEPLIQHSSSATDSASG